MEESDRLALQEILNNSAAMYAFIARLYRQEVDKDLLSSLHRLDFAAAADEPEIAAGYRMMEGFLRQGNDDQEVELAVDYARIFLGCGPKQGEGAFPYESVYTSPRGLIMQEARDQVVAVYRSEGMVRDSSFSEPEDHIAFELVFMEYLCRSMLKALHQEDEEQVLSCLHKQKEFLDQHLMNWVPGFCQDVERIAATDFYRGLAKVTVGYLRMEQELLNELLN